MQERHIIIEVSGIVQGVGFRPFVYNIAVGYNLKGWVYNHGEGVSIAVQGPSLAIDCFLESLQQKAPPLAKILTVSYKELPLTDYVEFVIRSSAGYAAGIRMIPPDIAVCEDCRDELFNPADRRFGYPFINCTNCGPRFTIIEDLPYDRPTTAMKHFTMCPDCQAEYDNPTNRRFHAQPNACSRCGPAYRLLRKDQQAVPGDALEQARNLLQQGAILAVKGLGGYHLACDARNEAAVQQLRRRKAREDKPFAVMVSSIRVLEKLCRLSLAESNLLREVTRPIVLLEKAEGFDLADSIAPNNAYLGAMLPYAPVHYLLCTDELPLVMTSGNASGDPIFYQDEAAHEELGSIADFYLTHDREILRSCDDSVMRLFDGAPMFLRRSRGYAPLPITMREDCPPMLAVGAEQKNTFALTRGPHVFLSQHIGDLENLETLEAFTRGIEQLRGMLKIDPQFIIHDLHPEYLSTKYAQHSELPLISVQHHHAHIAGVIAEYGLKAPVIGVAFDGTGYGADGHLWGGEFLVVDGRGYRRAGHFEYMPLLGGKTAIKQPWRIAYGYLQQLFGAVNLPSGTFSEIDMDQSQLLDKMLKNRLNTPFTSSVGRLFDAAAALAGLRREVSYEGQAAVELELAAGKTVCSKGYPFLIEVVDGTYVIRLQLFFEALCQDLRNKQTVANIAGAVHQGLSDVTIAVVSKIARDTGLKDVVLNGGVFQNYRLLSQTVNKLKDMNLRVYIPRLVPLNDGGIALGQVYVAAARIREHG